MFSKKKRRSPASIWAEEEVKKALAETPDENKKYLKLIYESALEAYNVLLEEGHSGLSISLTLQVLSHLIERKPLTSITEKDFEGVTPLDRSEVFLSKRGFKEVYQCPRYSSLFKEVYLDGSVSYSDNNRVETIDRFGAACHCGRITKMVDREFPITLPYSPGKPYKVYTIEFTYDRDKDLVTIDPGVYNSMYISHIVTPKGETITLKEWWFEEGVPENDITLSSIEEKLMEALKDSGLKTWVFKS